MAKKTFNGTSLSKNNLPHLRDLFSSLAEDKNVFYAIRTGSSYADVACEFRSVVNSSSYRLGRDLTLSCHGTGYSFQSIFNCLVLTYADATYHYEFSPLYDVFIEYSYNKSTKQYDYSDFVERQTFCSHIIELIDAELKRLSEKEWLYQSNLDLFEAIESDPLTESARESFVNYRTSLQAKYLYKHIDNN